jgi:hypothetical protein
MSILLNDATGIFGYITSNGRITGEKEVWNNMEMIMS